MKTVKLKSGEIKCVKDSEAEKLVFFQGAVYVPKSEWKKQYKKDSGKTK